MREDGHMRNIFTWRKDIIKEIKDKQETIGPSIPYRKYKDLSRFHYTKKNRMSSLAFKALIVNLRNV
jgi:hypothetical protein